MVASSSSLSRCIIILLSWRISLFQQPTHGWFFSFPPTSSRTAGRVAQAQAFTRTNRRVVTAEDSCVCPSALRKSSLCCSVGPSAAARFRPATITAPWSWCLAAAPPLQQQEQEKSSISSSSIFLRTATNYNDDEEDVEDDGPANNNNNNNENDDSAEEIKFDNNNDDRVLTYLSPDLLLPTRLRRLVARATRQYHATTAAASSSMAVGDSNGRRFRPEDDDDNYNDNGGSSSAASLTMDLAEWMDSEYKTRKVPLQLHITDNAAAAKMTTTITIACASDAERFMVEILSLCAMYRLPYEIVRIFLRGIFPLYCYGTTKEADSSLRQTTIRYLVHDITGWHDIRFPKGLAIKTKRRRRRWYQRILGRREGGGGWPNAEHAAALIAAAARQPAPPVVNRTELLLQSLRRQQQQPQVVQESRLLLLPSNSTATTTTTSSMTVPSTNNNNEGAISLKRITTTPPPLTPPRLGFKLYFPTASRRRQFINHIRGQWQSLYGKAKAQGRASFLGYYVFNFLLYTVGLWWHYWQHTTTTATSSSVVVVTSAAIPTTTTGGSGAAAAAAAARSILVRRYGKILGWLYATSQLCKLPKLLFAVAVAPVMRKRVLDHWHHRYGWSDRHSTVVAVMLLLGLFAALAAVPMWHEYRQLCRCIVMTTTTTTVGSTMEVVRPV